MKKHTHNFTLIEILTVVVISGILASILFPVLGHVQEKGKITEAKTLVSGMKTAILGYLTEYNFLPNPKGDTTDKCYGSWSSSGSDEYYCKICSILAYTDCENPNNGKNGKVSSTAKAHNGNGTRFLSATKTMFDGKGITDPWGFQLKL